MSQFTKAIKQNAAESYDMNHLLNNLSYSRKDSNAEKSVILEVPSESGAANPSTEDAESHNYVQETPQEKPVAYPCPQLSYNPKRCPPDLAQAERHAFAQRVSKFKPFNCSEEVAESTGVPIHPGGFGLCCELKKIFHLGPVISMYFVFVKQLAFLSFLFCCVGAAILSTCPNKDFTSYEKTMDCLIQDNKEAKKFILLIFSLMLVLFLVIYLFRKYQKLTKLACKKTLITPSDYTIMAYDMGRGCSDEEVRAFFSNYIIPGFSLDAQRIVSTQDIEKYVEKVRLLKALIKNKEEAEKVANYISNGVVEDIQSRIDDIANFFAANKDVLFNYKGLKRNGTCFITYGNKQEAKTVRRRFEFSVLERVLVWILEKVTDEFPEYFFKNNYFKVEKAPEVSEIIWEKLNCNTHKPAKRFLNLLIYSIIVAANFASAYYIRTSQQEAAYEYYRIYVVAVITAFLNEFIFASVSFLGRYGSFKTITEAHIAIQRKTIILQLINSAGPLLLLEYYFSNPIANKIDQYFAWDVLIISVATALLPLIIRFLNFPYRRQQSLKRQVIREVQNKGKNCEITQEQANQAFENPKFDINRVYIDTVRTLLFTCLFFCVSPAVAPVALVAFFLGYFVDKSNLLRKSLMPTVLRSEIAETMFEFVDLALFLLAVSGRIFLDFAKSDSENPDFAGLTSTLSLLTIILAGIYLLLPNKRYARKIFPTKRPPAWNNFLFYQQALDYMIHRDYYSFNPCSKEITNKKDYLEIYKDTYTTFKTVDILSHVPEILSIFAYADERPAPYEIGVGGYTGLNNPYYSFPQNYRFGFDMNNTSSFSDNSTIATPLLIEQHLPKEVNDKRKQMAKYSEMVPSSLLSNSANINDKPSFGSVKGVSLLRDIRMIPSVKSNASQINFEFHEVNSHTDSYHLPAFGGAESVNTFDEKQAVTGFTVSSQDAVGMLEGISPITGASLHRNIKK